MEDLASENQRLALENNDLKLKLHEAQELINAIKSGLIDALVIDGENGPDIYTLKSADHTYRMLVEEMNEGAVTITREGKILYCNHTFAEFLGFAPDEIVGTSLYRFVPSESQPFLEALLIEAWKGSSKGEIIIKGSEARRLPFLLSVKPFQYNENTSVLGVILTDLSAQKEIIAQTQALRMLEESENRFKTVIENAPIIFWALDKHGIFTISEGRGLKHLGLEPGEVVGKSHSELYKDYAQSLVPVKKTFEGNTVVEEVHIQGRWFETLYNPLKNGDGEINGIVAISTDITERRHAEEELKQSEERFRVLADNIPNLAWMADAEGWIFWYNKRWYEYTGTTEDQMKGWGWQSVHDATKLPEVMDRWLSSINTGQPFEMIFPLKGNDGLFRPFLTRVSPDIDNNGKILRWFGTNTDITERIKSEEELAIRNQELIRINNDLDNFVYTASHDLKAPISNLEGLLNSLNRSLAKLENSTPTIHIIVDLMEKSIHRFKETITGLTEISKAQKNINDDVEIINIEQLVEEVKSEISRYIEKEQAEIEVNTIQQPVIRLSKLNLKSIIQNLLTNAIKYRSPERLPKITLTTYTENDYSVIEVRDNGLGIPEANLSKIFEMFKRVHTHVEGTGIGLYIVKRIVHNADGKVNVESTLGYGTTFKIYLPL